MTLGDRDIAITPPLTNVVIARLPFRRLIHRHNGRDNRSSRPFVASAVGTRSTASHQSTSDVSRPAPRHRCHITDPSPPRALRLFPRRPGETPAVVPRGPADGTEEASPAAQVLTEESELFARGFRREYADEEGFRRAEAKDVAAGGWVVVNAKDVPDPGWRRRDVSRSAAGQGVSSQSGESSDDGGRPKSPRRTTPRWPTRTPGIRLELVRTFPTSRGIRFRFRRRRRREPCSRCCGSHQ